MNKKIFRLSFLSSIIILIISFIFVFGVLFEYFEGRILDELKSEANYISYAIQSSGLSYIDNFDNNNKRITLVSSDGKVLADTSASPSSLDNHSSRAEIADAIKFGNGTSTRYSDTLMQKTLYYAVKLDDGNILRVSTTQNSVFVILMGLLSPLCAILVLCFVLSLFISRRVSMAIIKPINELDLDNPANNVAYEELTPLLKKISAQKKTIHRQIKEATQKQEEFKLITENMSEGFLVIDHNATILTYNNAALKLLEIDEVTSGSVLLLNRSKGFRSVVETVLGGNHAESNIAIDERNYNLIANPVIEKEKVIGAVIVIVDVTERTQREQLRREFTANISHELKTPLTSISGFAEIMMAGGTPENTVMDFSKSIYDEAGRLITLVSDIIKLSELDESTQKFDEEPIDLHALVSDIFKRLRPLADRDNISLNIIGESVSVFGTRKILSEMIYNLCDNAIKYNNVGGTVNVRLVDTENRINLIVQDTGIGIPAAERDRVFERFYRVDKSHSKKISGTGLGLSIVKHAAAYHNADILLTSSEKDGTSITVSFKKSI